MTVSSLNDTLPPTDYLGWERALTRELLMVNETGDSSPIRSFEITPNILAKSIGFYHSDQTEVAVQLFKKLVCRRSFENALKEGFYPRDPTKFSPGCFSFLVATMLVAAAPDTDGKIGGEFRKKLRNFLNVSTGFDDLRGVELMWKKLKDWLYEKAKDDPSYRELILPNKPAQWTHIGYTLRIVFPTKMDITYLSHFCEQHSSIINEPRQFIREFHATIKKSKPSYGMIESFNNFKGEFEKGHFHIADHPFWILVKKCSSTSGKSVSADATLECFFDEDSNPLFRYSTPIASEFLPNLQYAAEKLIKANCSLSRYAERGVFIFHEVGHGHWQAEPLRKGRPLVGISSQIRTRLRGINIDFINSGDWWFSKDQVTVAQAEEILSLSGLANESDINLKSISISGGILTDGVWLGRPSFLPHIDSDEEALFVNPILNPTGILSIEADENIPGRANFIATNKVEGSWIIKPKNKNKSWSRKITFLADAVPFKSLDAPAYKFDHISDWEPIGTSEILRNSWSFDQSDIPGTINPDLIEAVYAGGKSGWSEQELIQLLHKRPSGISPWTILKWLEGITVLEPRLRPGWRGRVWTLVPPRLRGISSNEAIAEGALCQTFIDELKSRCSIVNARLLGKPIDTDRDVPILAVVSEDPRLLANSLGWDFADGPTDLGRTPLSFKTTSLTTANRIQTTKWSWTLRRFVKYHEDAVGRTEVLRWIHPEGRDHDVYTVAAAGASKTFLSRSAALAFAHSIEKIPLFSIHGSALVSQIPDASLPKALAWALRAYTGKNANIVSGCISYPIGPFDPHWLAHLLPNLIADLPIRNSQPQSTKLKSWRHSRGVKRPLWKTGRIVEPTGLI